MLRQDPHTGLGDLAQGTGGLIFESTNNLRTGFDRVESDLRNYYLIGYTPTNAAYNGTFRKIEVKVKRAGVTVAARKGYFAVRDTGGAPINTWEARALAALDRRPVPNAFPIRAGVLQFPSNARPGMVPVVVDFKTAPMSFPTAEDQKSFKSDFAIVVRFLGRKNEVVRKVGQHYEMAGDWRNSTSRRTARCSSTASRNCSRACTRWRPSSMTIQPARRACAIPRWRCRRSDPAKLRMSSLVLVKRGEKVPRRRAEVGPLFVEDVSIYPNLGDDVSKTAKELGFFFTVYPAAGRPRRRRCWS